MKPREILAHLPIQGHQLETSQIQNVNRQSRGTKIIDNHPEGKEKHHGS